MGSDAPRDWHGLYRDSRWQGLAPFTRQHPWLAFVLSVVAIPVFALLSGAAAVWAFGKDGIEDARVALDHAKAVRAYRRRKK